VDQNTTVAAASTAAGIHTAGRRTTEIIPAPILFITTLLAAWAFRCQRKLPVGRPTGARCRPGRRCSGVGQPLGYKVENQAGGDPMSQRPQKTELSPTEAARSGSWPPWWTTFLAGGLIVLAAVLAYCNSFGGPFIFDEQSAIAGNPTIRQLWPIWKPLCPPNSGTTVTGRPLLNLSFAVNYAIGGLNVWSYHAANLAIHILAALLLFGILQRTFLLPAPDDSGVLAPAEASRKTSPPSKIPPIAMGGRCPIRPTRRMWPHVARARHRAAVGDSPAANGIG